jgi:protein-L-isoaspartate(D-aspartate) O-methyltransferase
MESPAYVERAALVDQLRKRSRIRDPRVLAAFERVSREVFVPEEERTWAYADRALPLAEGQTVSQPTMIAIMLEALGCQPGDRALEVGAGSGYAAALLAQLVSEVHAIEVRPNLAHRARVNLAIARVPNVKVHLGDGNAGLPERAPFQRILVSAAAPAVPTALLEQLAPGGRIAIPVDAGEHAQQLLIGERLADGRIDWERGVLCTFVPLVQAGPALAPLRGP